MTKAFLEPIIIKPESGKLIMDAFSPKNIKQLKQNNIKKKLSIFI